MIKLLWLRDYNLQNKLKKTQCAEFRWKKIFKQINIAIDSGCYVKQLQELNRIISTHLTLHRESNIPQLSEWKYGSDDKTCH